MIGACRQHSWTSHPHADIIRAKQVGCDMRGCLMGLGGLFLFLIVFFAGMMLVLAKTTRGAAEYAETSLLEILPGYDIEELVRRAAPDAKSAFGGQESVKMKAYVAKHLGEFRGLIGEVSCPNRSFNSSTGEGMVRRAECYATAEYEKQNAEITMVIVKREEWGIVSIRFNIDHEFDDEDAIIVTRLLLPARQASQFHPASAVSQTS
ncbi:hypothetical protein [Parvularcula marina]|nr:hypothetical protein [Parvularcula marina]